MWPRGGRATDGAMLVLGTKNLANQAYVFVWTAKKSIKHVTSGMCINMRGSSLVLQKGCDSKPTMKFKKTSSGFKNIATKGYVMAGASLSGGAGIPLSTRKTLTPGSAFSFRSKRSILEADTSKDPQRNNNYTFKI